MIGFPKRMLWSKQVHGLTKGVGERAAGGGGSFPTKTTMVHFLGFSCINLHSLCVFIGFLLLFGMLVNSARKLARTGGWGVL